MSTRFDDMLKLSILSDENFEIYKILFPKRVATANLSRCKDVVSYLKRVIKSDSFPPAQKLRALNLLNLCMNTSNPHFLAFSQVKVLRRLSILACYKKEVPVEHRADGLFGKKFSGNPAFKEKNSEFIVCLLDYLKSWAQKYGKTNGLQSKFSATFQKLKESGVQFPADPEPENVKNLVKKPGFLETVEKLIEKIRADPINGEQYKKLIGSFKGSIQSSLKKAMNEGSPGEVKMFMDVLEDIAIVCAEDRSGENTGRSLSQLSCTPSDQTENTQNINSIPNQVLKKPSFDCSKSPLKQRPDFFEILQSENEKLKGALRYNENMLKEKSEIIKQLEAKILDLESENKSLIRELDFSKKVLSKNTQNNKENLSNCPGRESGVGSDTKDLTNTYVEFSFGAKKKFPEIDLLDLSDDLPSPSNPAKQDNLCFLSYKNSEKTENFIVNNS